MTAIVNSGLVMSVAVALTLGLAEAISTMVEAGFDMVGFGGRFWHYFVEAGCVELFFLPDLVHYPWYIRFSRIDLCGFLER